MDSTGCSGDDDDKTREKDNEHRAMKPKLKYSLSYCPSMSRPLDFSVKGPVPIYIHKKQKVLTGCSYIELKLQKHSKVGEITFRNYYTASVSILLLRSNTQGPTVGSRNWEIGIKNRILMKQPHCENGAQDYFSLFSTEVLTGNDIFRNFYWRGGGCHT
uniref:Nicolin-1 n=1 Tax=Sipha flava TaxID=143950 RepID=A0A2S2Q446_9HEMI